MKNTAELSERLSVGPAGLARRNAITGRDWLVDGAGYDEEHRHHYLTIQLFPMQDFYSSDPFPAARPAWRTRLYGLLLAGAILGLFACLCWFGFVAFN